MKRWLVWTLVLAALLSGCTEVPGGNPTGSTGQTEATQQQTEDAQGLYAPESQIEQETFGAVRAYPLESSCTGIAFMGGDLLLAECGDDGITTLTLLTGQTCIPKITVKLDCEVFLDTGVCVTGNAVGYYNGLSNSIVLLNEKLEETDRISMPDNLVGTPVFSSDLSEVYYCTGGDIRGMELKTGVSRLIRKSSAQPQTLVCTVFDDTVLQSFVDTGAGSYTEFISAQTGEAVGMDRELIRLAVWGSSYYLERLEGAVTEHLFGTLDGQIYSFTPETDTAKITALLTMDALVSAEPMEAGTELSLYNLNTGKKTASVLLDLMDQVCFLTADPTGQAVWFSAYDESRQQDALYRWEASASAVEDSRVYTGIRYTKENPDTQGLAQVKQQAEVLSEKYGVTICLENTPVQPEDYTLVYEYQVKAFRDGLTDLEKVLSAFPEGFLRRLARVSSSGELQIGLVREMYGTMGQVPSDVVGLQYWVDGNAYIALNLGETLEQAAYHELAHVLDTYVLNNCSDFDVWDRLNPDGFTYHQNYTDYLTLPDKTYLEGEDRAFIDAYSMTFAKEDRARVFEYAMMEDCGFYFESDTMQAKLKLLCEGIRDACNWKKDTRTFPWEQYLKESLAYTEDK